MTKLVTWSLGRVRQSKWTVVPTDKYGGFAFELRSDQVNIHSDIFEKIKMYQEAHPSTCRVEDINELAVKINKQIELHEKERGLATMLNRSFRRGTVISRLTTTCKTHKPDNMVKHRNIHSSSKYQLEGTAKWLSLKLRQVLLQQDHIVKDTMTFVKQIKRMTAMPWHMFIKLDIEEFFNSRRPHQLVDDCARLVDEGAKPLFKTGHVLF